MIHISFSSEPKALSRLVQKQEQSLALLHMLIQQAPFFSSPFSLETKEILTAFSQLQLPTYTRVCVIGVGGSSLGTKAFAHACGITTLDFLDTVDPLYVDNYLKNSPLHATLFFIVSKSGETAEVIALTTLLMSKKVSVKRIIGICEKKQSTLFKILKKYGVQNIFDCPKNVPGRFSVLTPVGLLPLTACGLAISKSLERLGSLDTQSAVNLAYRTGWHYRNGKNILPLFIYSEALHYFADWYIQLLSESMGKKKNIGITPLKAVGIKDQHAQLQLFLDGPRDKFFIFIKPIIRQKLIPLPGLGYSLNELFDAEYEGVKGAFNEKKCSFAEIITEGTLADSITALFYFFEVHVAALCMLFNVDYENQPAVELSKSITRKLLIK